MLYKFLKEKYSYREISKIIGKSVSSIFDEIKRNTQNRESYDPYEAHKRASQRIVERKRRRKIEISSGLKKYIVEKLIEDWSPEEIAGVLREEAEGKTIISHETIYQFIYSLEGKSLKLWQHLRHKKESYRRGLGARRTRPIIPARISIHQRPAVINQRQRFGDYEGDLMVFSSSPKVLAVFVERKTRKVFVTLNENKTAQEMEYSMHEMITSSGIHFVQSMTLDNGLENVCHEKVRNDYGNSFTTYFCDPYSSWQKGTVENTNKLLRQYFPRNIAPEKLTQDFVDSIVKKLNNRPRKCLHYSTPYQEFKNCSV